MRVITCNWKYVTTNVITPLVFYVIFSKIINHYLILISILFINDVF